MWVTVDFNFLEAHKHPKAIDHRAGRQELTSTTESGAAPGDLVERLRNLPARWCTGRRRAAGAEEAVRGRDGRVAVVVVTRNRLPELLTTLGHLRSLPESPRVVVVDNASTDGTARTVRERFPEVEVVALPENIGGAGRNVGVRKADAPYVAFSDDDSWWASGSLSRAADLFDAHPRLGLVAARTLVGPEEREDPINADMEHVPLPPEPDLPGPLTLGFLACASVVRRVAYLEAGGFKARMMIGGEEELLAADMAAAGWGLAYVSELTAHHHPSTVRA